MASIFQWLTTKKAMIEEMNRLRVRAMTSEAQVRLLGRKLQNATNQIAALSAIRKSRPALPVKKDDHQKAPTYGSMDQASPSGGFPFGALVSRNDE